MGTLVAVLALWSVTLPVSSQALAETAAEHPVIYVVRRGWHVDVGFAAETLMGPLRSLATTFPGVRYVLFGFGDRRYLLSRHRKGPAMLAALWPGDGLILTTALGATPQLAFGPSHVTELNATPLQIAKAQAFISNSASANGELTIAADGPYEGSVYLSSNASYSALHTCNTWAAEVLKSAGFPVRSKGVVFASQIWSTSQRVAAAQQATATLDLGH